MANSEGLERLESLHPAPLYEFRALTVRPGTDRYEIWQIPCPATPQVKRPLKIGALAGRTLELVQHRILRRLVEQKIRLVHTTDGETVCQRVPERLAVTLGLMFRALAPLRSRDTIRLVAEGIEVMEREEAAYWLGMAIHRPHPRRVLAGLRMLLTEPPASPGPEAPTTRARAKIGGNS